MFLWVIRQADRLVCSAEKAPSPMGWPRARCYQDGGVTVTVPELALVRRRRSTLGRLHAPFINDDKWAVAPSLIPAFLGDLKSRRQLLAGDRTSHNQSRGKWTNGPLMGGTRRFGQASSQSAKSTKQYFWLERGSKSILGTQQRCQRQAEAQLQTGVVMPCCRRLEGPHVLAWACDMARSGAFLPHRSTAKFSTNQPLAPASWPADVTGAIIVVASRW